MSELSRYLEFSQGKSHKFWKIELNGLSQTITFGRIGTKGQTLTKDFGSNELARKAYEKLVAEKITKGYVDPAGRTQVSSKEKKAASRTPTGRMKTAIGLVSADDDVFPPFSGPVSEREIDRVQRTLKLPITGSYREFVRQLGDQQDFGICGVNVEYKDAGTLWGTRLMRKEYGLAKHYLVVYVDEGHDEALALDCSQSKADGEYPLYFFHPPDWEGTLTKVSDSFIDWFEQHFEIRTEKKNQKKERNKR
jgi:predicted DNA-binding WGR domain protein